MKPQRSLRRLVSGGLIALPLLFPAIVLAEEPPAAARPKGLPGSVYEKPFLARIGDKVTLGGYMDIEFIADEKASTFTAHRFVPFIYANVSDRVTVASEIEYEYGGLVKGTGETDGEIKIEFAHLDFRFSDGLNFRGGLILSPLGRFNLTHDSPTNDLTERPLVDQQIMPTTLFEAGMGFYGGFDPSENSVLTYEAYLVNGFNEDILRLNSAGEANGQVRVRSGRGSAKTDNNNNRALVSRVGFSPALGIDLGASIHTGRYTDRANPSGTLTIAGFDGAFNRGPLELLGEYGLTSVDIPEAMAAEGAATDVSQAGYYLQANWHFLPGVIKSLPNSVFTAVVRFDQVDYDTDIDGDRDRRLAIGGNFRPTEDTAFKLDVTRNWKAARGVDSDGEGFDSFHFSVATYF